MALCLAGLRGVDGEIFKAAQLDGASLPTVYRKIVIPSMRPVFFSVMLILAHITIKTFDLVASLTAGAQAPRRRCRPCLCTPFRSVVVSWASAPLRQ